MASQIIYVHQDLNGNALKNALLDPRGTDPGSPAEGQVWENTTSHLLKYFDGTNTLVPVTTIYDGSTSSNVSAGRIQFSTAGTGLTGAVSGNVVTFTLNSAATTGANKVVLAGAGGLISATFMTGVLAVTDLTTPSAATSTNNAIVLAGGTGKISSTYMTGVLGVADLSTSTTGSGNIVLASSPTIVTPTIASFANATHSHTNSAGGGTLTHAAISDFDTQVRTSSLDQMTVAAADVSMNSHKITNLSTPSAGTDAANKNYVDSSIQGLVPKPTAAAATTAALATCTYSNGTSGVGATLTANSNGTLTVDSYVVAVGDLILVKDQVSGFQNGLYVVTAPLGDGSHPFILTRHIDMDTVAEFSGAFIPVSNLGTTNANTLWLANPSGTVTVGTTAIPFTRLNSGTSYTNGTGITISGTAISIDVAWTGQTAITTVGTIGTGTWAGTTIAVNHGGTGQTTAAAARGTSGIGSNTAPTAATNVTVSATGVYTGVTATMTGTGSATAFTITHNLNRASPFIGSVLDSTGNVVVCGVQATDANTVVVTFNVAPLNTVVYTLTIMG